MKIRMRGFLGAAVIATALAGLGLGLFACSKYDPMLPEYNVGVVEGRVTLNGEAYAVDIEAEAQDQGRNHSRVSVPTDSSGWFHLELPAGLYIVKPDLVSSSFRNADSLRIRPQTVVKRDFTLGSASIEVHLPEDLERRSANFELYSRQIGAYQSGTVLDGVARFDFPVLRSTTYNLYLKVEGCIGFQFPDPDSGDDSRDSLRVVSGTPALRELDYRSTYASIEGLVTQTGQNDDSTWIRLEDADCYSLESRRCEDDGSFGIGFLTPPGPITLYVDQGQIERWYGGRSCEDATVFDLQAGTRIEGIEIPASALRLDLHGPGEQIFYDATVVIRDETGFEATVNVRDFSPQLIGNLTPGRYFVQVNGIHQRQTWAAQWYGGAESLGAATPIDLEKGEVGELEFHLVPGGSVSGKVYFEDGQELRVVHCAVFDFQGLPLDGGGYNSGWPEFPDGVFSFSGLPDGKVYLAARISQASTTWYPGTLDFAAAVPITIRDHESVEDISWDLIFGGKSGR